MLSSLLRSMADKSGGGDTVALVLAAGQERLISMRYSDEAAITEPSIYLLRHISEIRDQWISVHSWGQAAVDGYYGGKGASLELRFERNWAAAAAAMASVVPVLCWLLFGFISQRRKIASAPWGQANS